MVYLSLLSLGLAIASLSSVAVQGSKTDGFPYCQPSEGCWPNDRQFQKLEKKLNRPLIYTAQVDYDVCRTAGDDGTLLASLGNGTCMQQHDCSKKFCNALEESNQPFAVVDALNNKDVKRALRFASRYNIMVTIKSSGHSYSGSSTGKNSLLIWLHNFEKEISIVEDFDSCGVVTEKSLKVSAGTTWLEAYQAAGNDYHIVGGGYNSVSACGGWLMGGGLSTMSRKYGLGVDNVLEFELVTVTGDILTVNACHNKDLFWALRGGGGGTFGVITSVVYKIYPAEPVTKFIFDISKDLLAVDPLLFLSIGDQFLEKWVDLSVNLDNNWGGYFQSSTLLLSYVGNMTTARKTLIEEFEIFKASFEPEVAQYINIVAYEAPSFFLSEGQNFATEAITGFEAFNISSRVIQKDWVEDNKDVTKDALKTLLRNPYIIHLSYLLGGVMNDVLPEATAVNPAFRNVIYQIETLGPGSFDAMQKIRDITPTASSGYNHGAKNEPNWRHAFWGENLGKLQSLKKAYDPENRLNCWHCVGYQGEEV
eukprot:Awhi_evm1s11395